MNPFAPTPPCAGFAQFRRARPTRAPVLRERCARARPNRTASPALMVAALRAASSPFPPSPFQILVGRSPGKDGVGNSSPSHVRPGLRQAGAKGELRCVVTSAIRAGSPSGSSAHAFGASVRFIQVSWLSTSPVNVRSIAKPKECAKAASWEFSAQVFDDENNTSDVGSEGRCIRETVRVAVRK
jgi:hypothetical protein